MSRDTKVTKVDLTTALKASQDAGHVEDLGGEVGEVGDAKHDQGLEDGSLVHEPGDQSTEVAHQDSYQGAAACHSDETHLEYFDMIDCTIC